MNKNVPKLRFKDFEDDWKINKLDENTYIKGRIGWKNLKQEEYTNEGPYLIAGKHIKDGIINWDICDHIPFKRYEESMEIALQDGDIIFSKDGSIGNPALINNLKVEATINGTMMLIRLDNTKYYPNYFYQVLKSRYFEKLIRNVKSGSSIPHIFQRDMIDFKFPMTSLQEQERIANFLSNVDKIIEEQEGKVKDLELYKKGMMQKIFKQEIRFKDDNGIDYADWEEKKLGEISKFTNGKAHENSISSDGKYIVINSKFISTEAKVYKYSDKCLSPLKINDIAIVMSDVPNGKALAKTFFVDKENLYTLNQRIGGIRILSDNSKFIQYSIDRNKYYLKFDSGVGQTNLKKNEILECPIKLPCLEEQTKIANFLSNIDNILEEENKKLEELRKLKKGLLQQMFV